MTGHRIASMGKASEIWTIQDVADYLGCSTWSIRRYYQGGSGRDGMGLDFSKLERFRVGGMWRWFASEVKAFARAK